MLKKVSLILFAVFFISNFASAKCFIEIEIDTLSQPKGYPTGWQSEDYPTELYDAGFDFVTARDPILSAEIGIRISSSITKVGNNNFGEPVYVQNFTASYFKKGVEIGSSISPEANGLIPLAVPALIKFGCIPDPRPYQD